MNERDSGIIGMDGKNSGPTTPWALFRSINFNKNRGMMDNLLQQGIAAVKAGNKEEAFSLYLIMHQNKDIC